MTVSWFESVFDKAPFCGEELEDIFLAIKEGVFKDRVELYRETENKKTKQLLPCYTPSGFFSKRDDEHCDSPTGVICLDIDAKDNTIDLGALKQQLTASNKCFCAHLSVGGKGLAVYYKIAHYKQENHPAYYEFFEDSFKQKNVKIDSACKNISRLRFVSYDKELYLNVDCSEVEIEIKKKIINETNFSDNTDDFILLCNRIIDIGIDICDDYTDWIRVGFAISKTLGEEGRILYHQISSLGVKYDARGCDRVYNSALRNSESARERFVNRSTLFYLCKQYGITINDLYEK